MVISIISSTMGILYPLYRDYDGILWNIKEFIGGIFSNR
jgi:hypothetical protein